VTFFWAATDRSVSGTGSVCKLIASRFSSQGVLLLESKCLKKASLCSSVGTDYLVILSAKGRILPNVSMPNRSSWTRLTLPGYFLNALLEVLRPASEESLQLSCSGFVIILSGDFLALFRFTLIESLKCKFFAALEP